MIIQLIDRNKGLCDFWQKEFKNYDDIFVYNGDIFDLTTDCVVSPANSFGYMDGGIDLVILSKFGTHIQHKLQEIIKTKYFGELLVGQAVIVETHNIEIPYLISAPTMRTPTVLKDAINVYLSTKAIFNTLKNQNKINKVTISGVGTGIGNVPVEVCAKQMRLAYEDFWLGNFKFPKTQQEALKHHYYLN